MRKNKPSDVEFLGAVLFLWFILSVIGGIGAGMMGYDGSAVFALFMCVPIVVALLGIVFGALITCVEYLSK